MDKLTLSLLATVTASTVAIVHCSPSDSGSGGQATEEREARARAESVLASVSAAAVRGAAELAASPESAVARAGPQAVSEVRTAARGVRAPVGRRGWHWLRRRSHRPRSRGCGRPGCPLSVRRAGHRERCLRGGNSESRAATGLDVRDVGSVSVDGVSRANRDRSLDTGENCLHSISSVPRPLRASAWAFSISATATAATRTCTSIRTSRSAPLPGNAQAITNSLNNHRPSGLTTTAPALQGAINQAVDFKRKNPTHVTIVVLVTDGQPNQCGDKNAVIAAAQAGLAGNPSIKTYVIGITAEGAPICFYDANPPNVPDLDAVANAGGTQTALIVDSTQNTAGQQFLDKMEQIRKSSVLPCDFAIPRPRTGLPNFNEVKVSWTAGAAGSTTKPLPKVTNEAACNGDGWFFDNNSAPKSIRLCPTTCATVTADKQGALNVTLGCSLG